jgi:hypothetical protein
MASVLPYLTEGYLTMTSNFKIKGKFYPLNHDELLSIAHANLTRFEILVLYYIRTLDPYSDGIEISASQIAKDLSTKEKEVCRQTVSRALKKLDTHKYIDLEIIRAVVKLSGKGLLVSANTDGVCTHQGGPVDTIGCEETPSGACTHQGEPVDTIGIYKERARAQTSLDSNKTESDSHQEEEKHEPANGDSGSKEPTPQPLEREEVSDRISQDVTTKPLDDPQEKSKSVIAARDNKAINLKDPFYSGALRAATKQLADVTRASQPKRNFHRDNCWGRLAVTHGFDPKEAYELLVKWIAKKAKGKKDPTAYAQTIIRRWSEVEGSEDASDYWQQFERMVLSEGFDGVFNALNSKPESAPTDRPPLTQEEEAWIALTSEIQHVCEDWQDVSVGVILQNGLWIARSNLSGCNGRLGEVMARFPLASLPSNFSDWYAKCYDRAKKKSPHLPLPEPLAKQPKAS